MLAHYLRKLFLCKSNHKSVSLKLNLPGSFLALYSYRLFSFTYLDTLVGYYLIAADTGLPEVGVFSRSAKYEAHGRSVADTLAKQE